MAYAILAEGRGGQELEELDATIGMTEGAEQVAMEMLRQHQEAAGMTPSAETPAWQDQDEEFR